MSRSEERVESIPLMKMMHLMVHRRQAPEKKTSSSVNETLNDGLVTFALDRQELETYKPQQILKHPPRRTFRYPESDGPSSPRNIGEEAVRRADFEQALREAANSASRDGNGDDWSSSGNRRNRKQLHRICLGPTLSTSLSFHETRNAAPLPEKLMADDSTGKFAYISLDGRLINAELATSARSIGGTLGAEEAQAWEDFVPMQRILIVAVSAAAAAAAKHRNRDEIDRLLRTVEKRVLRNRQHRIMSAIASLCNIILSSLHTFFWTLITTMGVTSLWSLLSWSGMLTGRLKLLPSMWSQENELFSLRQELNELYKHTNTSANDPGPFEVPESLSVRGSPKTPIQEQPPVLNDNFNGDNIRVNLNLQEAWSSSKPHLVSELRVQGENDESQLPRDSPDALLVESSPCRSESFSSSALRDEARAKEEAKWYVNPMVESSEDFYNISTPERKNSMFSVCNPAVRGTFEWEVLRSSFASREMNPSAGLSPLVDSTLTTTQMTVSDSSYRTRSQRVEDDEAVHKEQVVMGALCAAVILDLRKRILSVLDKEASMVMAALDNNVRDAKSQLESMHLAVASCWNASMLKALAALSLSPSEFDCWLLNKAEGACALNDTSSIEESIVAWSQYLEKNGAPSVGAEKRSPNKFNLVESRALLSGADKWLAPLAYPRFDGLNEGRRIGVLSGGLACSRDLSEDSTDQLLGESDKTTAKVKGCEDVAVLVKQLESKEVEVEDLKKDQQTLLEAKNKEIEELKEDFRRRDAELDKRLAAVETTKADSADRLAMLEEICKEKDSALSNMKQDIQALESKVQKSRVYQSPVTQRGRRYSTSSTPSSSSGNGTSQKQRFSDRHVPSAPSSDRIHEHIGRFKKEVPSNKNPLPYINTQRHEELTDDGRSEHGYDQETSHDYSSPPGSTIGDDCSVTSLAFSETEVESRFGSEYCSSGDDSKYRSSKDRLYGAKDSSHTRTLQKQKSASSDLRRAVTSTATSSRSLTRTQSNKNFTSATSGSKPVSGEKYSSKPLQRNYSGEIKKVPNSPRTSLGSSNLRGMGSVVANHRRASSLDMNFKTISGPTLETSGLSVGTSDCGSPNSQENSAMKRKRWV
ncbi:hypothetical protein M758_5G019800 [Ceratodon purpureus]|nr:hypothetical protein M758_5G019800 [Ceratodon purpureus]